MVTKDRRGRIQTSCADPPGPARSPRTGPDRSGWGQQRAVRAEEIELDATWYTEENRGTSRTGRLVLKDMKVGY